MKTVQNWNEIPHFDDESEEADFWAKHTLEPRLMNASLHRPSVRESTTITLRFDPQMLLWCLWYWCKFCLVIFTETEKWTENEKKYMET